MPYVLSHDTPIYYEVHGEGERTLVFAHGMGGNAAIWFNQVAFFRANYRVIIFDHRYFARSRCDQSLFKPDWFADDALAILDALGITQAAFVCQSMGGWTGSQIALRHRDRLTKLVMSHTPGIFTHASAINDPEKVRDMVSQPRGAFGNAALADDFPTRDPAGAVLYNQISSFNGIDPSAVPRSIGRAGLGVDTATLTDWDVPTLFISADKDILFPADYIESLASSLKGARFTNLGDAGHSSYFERPTDFNRAVQAFLAE